jgi:O-antigen ligase
MHFGPTYKGTIGNIFLISSLLAIFVAILNQYLLVGILIVSIIYFIFVKYSSYKFWEFNFYNNLIYLIIIAFLIAISDLGETLRLIITIASILSLSYLFLKKYGFQSSQFPKLPGRISAFFVLVIFSMILSTIFSKNIIIGTILTSRQIFFFVILYILYSFIQSEKIFYGYIFSIIVAGGILSISIVYTFINSEKLVYLLATTGLVTDAGYFKNQAGAGGLLAVSIPLTFAFIVLRDRKYFQKQKFFLMLFVIEFISLILTNSRAAIGSCIISLMLMTFILNRILLKKILLIVTIIVCCLILLFPNLIDLFLAFFRTGRILENTRYYLWDMGFGMFKDNPILGVGPGLFQDHMYKYLPLMFGTWEEQGIRMLNAQVGSNNVGISHNFFVSKASELGIIGLLTAIILPYIFFYKANKVIKSLKYYMTDSYPIIVAIYCIGIGLIYRSFFEVTGFISYGWISRDLPFWLVFISLSFYTESKFDNPKRIAEKNSNSI